MLKAALNCRFSGTPQPTGTQIASFQLFDAILRQERDFTAVAFVDSRFPGVAEWRTLPQVEIVEVPFQDMGRGRAHWWEQVELPMLAEKHGCRIVHHPMTTSSLWHHGLKSVVTLHDLNFHLHPEWYSKSFRLVYRLFAVPGFHRADRVVTISRYVENQVRESMKVSPERLRMIYNGVKAMKPGQPRPGEPPYILCVGSLQPHKNLARMIKAYLAIRSEFSDLTLNIVGRPQARFTQESELPGLLSAEGVKLLGYLSEEDLATAYANTEAFCYPSLEEGFGLPILEAMTLGAPVLTSNVSCLPEVAGPATQVDPYSVEAMAAGLRELLSLSPGDKAARIAAGRAWAAKFSWQAAARGYIDLYRELF